MKDWKKFNNYLEEQSANKKFARIYTSMCKQEQAKIFKQLTIKAIESIINKLQIGDKLLPEETTNIIELLEKRIKMIEANRKGGQVRKAKGFAVSGKASEAGQKSKKKAS